MILPSETNFNFNWNVYTISSVWHKTEIFCKYSHKRISSTEIVSSTQPNLPIFDLSLKEIVHPKTKICWKFSHQSKMNLFPFQITCEILWCFYQLSGLSFWRYPFTAEHPLVSKWWNANFLLFHWKNKLIYCTSWMAWVNFQQIFIFGFTIALRCICTMRHKKDVQSVMVLPKILLGSCFSIWQTTTIKISQCVPGLKYSPLYILSLEREESIST